MHVITLMRSSRQVKRRCEYFASTALRSCEHRAKVARRDSPVRFRNKFSFHSKTYGFAPSPNKRYGLRCAMLMIVCANTEFAQANQLPIEAYTLAQFTHSVSLVKELTCIIRTELDVDALVYQTQITRVPNEH